LVVLYPWAWALSPAKNISMAKRKCHFLCVMILLIICSLNFGKKLEAQD
jgi:hypothetical protein